MFPLFLEKPLDFTGDNAAAAKEWLSLLQAAESILRDVTTSGGCLYETRLWLCNTVSMIHSIAPRHHHELFVDILESRGKGQSVAVQLLRMIFERRPKKAGRLLAKKCYMLENFFEGNPARILQWFDHFAAIGESGHKKGAKAISQYAFLNRDVCWEELEWKGNHGQSPAVVATKPHYFHDLDILKTVENFIKYVPDFWSSDELAESVRDGEIFKIDVRFFIDEFIYLMYEENNKDVMDIIEEFIEEEQFSALCQQLLPILDEQSLHIFLSQLGSYIRLDSQCKGLKYPCCWLEIILSSDSSSLEPSDLLLLNAVIVRSRQLLHLLNDEEHDNDKKNMDCVSSSIKKFSNADHYNLMRECANLKIKDSIKWVGIQSWIHMYNLSSECGTSQACESLFANNGIQFQRADKYSLIRHDLSEYDFNDDEDDGKFFRSSTSGKRNRNKKRKKKHEFDKDSLDLLELENLAGGRGLQSVGSLGSSWFLSTDNFSSSWHMVDVPEHLSSFYFKMWAKWVCE